MKIQKDPESTFFFTLRYILSLTVVNWAIKQNQNWPQMTLQSAEITTNKISWTWIFYYLFLFAIPLALNVSTSSTDYITAPRSHAGLEGNICRWCKSNQQLVLTISTKIERSRSHWHVNSPPSLHFFYFFVALNVI